MTPITNEERQQRQAAIDFARGSVRLEGFALPAEAEMFNRRYVQGEITTAQRSRSWPGGYWQGL